VKITLIHPPEGEREVIAPPSKSMAHRLLICAALADAPMFLRCSASNADIDATIGCLRALGAVIDARDGRFYVEPIDKDIYPDFDTSRTLDCGESGSTLRFLLPVAACLGAGAKFVRRGRLSERPLEPLYGELIRHGAILPDDPSGEPLTLCGKIGAGCYTLAADVSSQFVSGLLMALAMKSSGGESTLTLTGNIESAGYIRMTLAAMERFGCRVKYSDDLRCFEIPGAGYLSPGSLNVEGDWSAAAVALCCGALCGGVTVSGLDPRSLQYDRQIIDILRNFGADTVMTDTGASVRPAPLHGITADMSQTPDLAPAVASVAAFAEGETVLTGVQRLRLKECDRAAAIVEMLTRCGIYAAEYDDRIVIRGGSPTSCELDCRGDHRMVMCGCLLAAGSGGGMTLDGCEAVDKSWPGFFEDMESLGAKFEIVM